MSAVVCGSKRTYFDDLPGSSASSPSASSPPPVSKRLRCSSTSPVRFSTPSAHVFDHLRAVFPHMDSQVLERVLEECGNDLDAAIKRLQELCLGSVENKSSPQDVDSHVEKGMLSGNGHAAAAENTSALSGLPANGEEWVESFVREMSAATSLDDARMRASRMLEMFEKSISAHASAEAAQNIQKENQMLREQIEGLMRENSILKRAVTIQHERQKEYDERNDELQHLKQLVSQYQEQIRTLEMNNYALSMHLKQAQQSNSFPGRFNPDIF